MSPETGLAVCRFLHDLSAMLLWGCFALLSTLIPRCLAQDVARRLAAFRWVAILAVAASAAAVLPLEAAVVGAGWGDALDPGTLRAVLLETSIGRAWQVEAAAAVLLLLTLAVPCRAGVTAAVAALSVAALALGGHAAMHQGWLGIAHPLNDALHVLAAGAWLGALVALLPILRDLGRPPHDAAAGLALRRFSIAGHLAVALVVLSGVVNTLLVLGRWPTDWSSPYQAMLAAKILLVILMTGLAALNRYVFVPRLARRQRGATAAIRRGTIAELALGAGVIGLVAVFGMLDPR